MKELKDALRLFLFLTFATGLVYPVVMTTAAQLLFPHQANGSPLATRGAVVGSDLLGQSFLRPDFFHGRPAANSLPYDPSLSGGSNLSAGNPALREQAAARAAALIAENAGQQSPIPADLLTASASGLDPHISLAAARWQVKRVARARGLPEQDVAALVDELAERRVLAFLGEPRVNVLRLNLELARRAAAKSSA